jgi:NADH-quinone oxidoreductase subunit G
VIVGTGALRQPDAYAAARALTSWLGASFNLLHTAASRVGALDLGFTTPGGLARSARSRGAQGAVPARCG